MLKNQTKHKKEEKKKKKKETKRSTHSPPDWAFAVQAASL